jgi:ABC-type Fe3+/spermidine/putrescine transport system ATPase subunit
LRVAYSGTVAIDGVDLDVSSGELVAVLGASGSGKSTLLHAIAGLVAPVAGTIRLAGREVATPQRSLSPEQRNVGLVFQDFALWPHLSALDTVAYPLRRVGRSRQAARAVAQHLLDQLDIGDLAARRPAELSGGQQQRVGLARALARAPAAFLLDEPTAHLDTHLRAAFQASVRDRQAATGAAAIYATHDAGEALALADRVALLEAGRLVQVATPEVVYGEPVSVATAVLTGPCSVLPARVAALGDGRLSLDLGVGPVAVGGGGAASSEPVAAQVLLRPDWLHLGGPLAGRVTATAFRGTHTDYRLQFGDRAVGLQLPGPPTLVAGESVSWGIRRAWALPAGPAGANAETAAQPSAVIAPG